jgi:hypothetical protein
MEMGILALVNRWLRKLSGGQRKVPVIVEGETVTIGFGGT